MQRTLLPLAIVFVSLAAVNPARADIRAAWNQFWAGVDRDFHRNNAWPRPFVEPDRMAVRSALAAQAANGWRMQTMVADHHFDDQTQQLTRAGEAKVRWILTQAPVQRRTVFVKRGSTKEDTAVRVDSIQQFAVKVLPEGELPAVEETNLEPKGWPADRINKTYVDFGKVAPLPVLPEAAGEE